MRLSAILSGLLVMAPASSAVAQHEGHECSAETGILPQSLENWRSRQSAQAADEASTLRDAGLAVGTAIDAGLRPTGEVRFIVRPEKPGGSVSYGGMFSFVVERAGTYRVALGAGAWVDLLAGEKAIASIAHGHGPECTGIRKMVDFPLTPGRYTLQIAGNGTPSLPLMVARLP